MEFTMAIRSTARLSRSTLFQLLVVASLAGTLGVGSFTPGRPADASAANDAGDLAPAARQAWTVYGDVIIE
jgi:hypothetical protein